jgi:glycosyltransferase involved in cell wall biosynthesis
MSTSDETSGDGRVSVVIPAWNAARYLGAAIESVLAEGDPIAEIIVVDDGSSDETASVAMAYPKVSVVPNPERRGIAATRNLGVRSTRGELLAFVDADDLWVAGRLARQIVALARRPDIIVLGHSREVVSPDLSAHEQSMLRPKPGRSPGFLIGAILTRRATFDRIGWFDETLPVGEFIAWFKRAAELGIEHHILSELVLERRLHRDNFTRGQDQRQAYVGFARRMIEQRRAAARLAAEGTGGEPGAS